MTTIGIHSGTHERHAIGHGLDDPVQQARAVLRVGFTVAPIAFGLDKFFGLLADWERYLAPQIADALPGGATELMYAVGVVEVVAGLVVALRPRFGAYLVAAWLAGIIANLLLLGDHFDIALRDVGLLLGALALARLSAVRPDRGHAGPSVVDRPGGATTG